jgi:eukaryotic-like serine/threonine-protein kinase
MIGRTERPGKISRALHWTPPDFALSYRSAISSGVTAMLSRESDAERIFLEAVQNCKPESFPDFVERMCGDDRELRERVEALWKAHDQPNRLLDGGIAATIDLPPIAERPGTQIGPYKLIEEIGEGGMGVVYMAAQKEPVRRKVALKIIKPGMDTREVIARFAAEEQALALMDHPNIARVFDAGTTQSGRPYFVMELVNGVPLTQYCDDNNATTPQRLELFVLLCHAVQHAHQKGIIHRDIKPSNILVTMHDGVPVPKIIDFGIAKAINQQLTANTVYTGHGQMVGTPLYMSPEQAEHSGLDIDTRSDIYSLGVLLYELLTGSTPFDGEQLKDAGYDEVRRLIREQEPPRPSTRVSTLGKLATTVSEHRRTDPVALSNSLRHELDWIVMKALEKDRTRRYQTANDFARDIERYLDDEPVEACPPSRVYRLRKFTRRHQTAAIATAAVGLSLLLGTGVAVAQAYRATQAEKYANEQLQIAQEQKRLAEEAAERESKFRAAAEEATRKAEAARQQAETAVDCLIEFFRSPDPEKEGRSVTVAELLDKARDRVAKEFQQDLALQVRLLEALGETYGALGLPRDAVELLEKARDIRRDTLGVESRETLQVMEGLSAAYFEATRPGDSLRLAEELLTHAAAACGPEDSLTLEAQQLVGVSQLDLGQLDKAIPLLEESLALHQKVQGMESSGALDAMNNLASAYGSANRLEESLTLHQQVFDISVRTQGKEHPRTIAYMHNLGCLYYHLHRYEEAVPLLTEALELSKKVSGPESSATLQVMHTLALAYGDTGRLKESVALLEEQWQLTQKVFGLESRMTPGIALDLVKTYQVTGQFKEAIALLEVLLKATESKYGAQHERTFEILEGLANLHLSNDDPEAAIAVLTRMQSSLPQGANASDVKARNVKSLLASALSMAHRHQEAVAVADEVLQLMTSTGQDDPDGLNTIGVVYSQAGRYEDAARVLERALPQLRAAQGEKGLNTLTTMYNLGTSYMRGGRYTDAITLLTQTLELQREILGADNPYTLRTMGYLPTAYRKAGRDAKANEWSEQILELWLQSDGSGTDHKSKPPCCIDCLYRELGRIDEALRSAQEMVEQARGTYGDDDDRTISAKRCLARAYAAAGNLDQAVNLFREVSTSFTSTRGPEHPLTLEAMQYLAETYRRAGNRNEAADLLQQTVTGRLRALGAQHPDTLTTMIQLGSVLAERDEYAKADPLLQEAYEGFTQRREAQPTPYDDSQAREACAQLVQLYEKSLQPEKAAAWKEKLTALTEEPKKDEGSK